MSHLTLPIRAVTETVLAHGITPDRCEVLQDGNTLVLRLTETLVARVVQDVEGPRKGTEWFARETALARHLTHRAAPVVPMHPDLPQEPHEHLGYTMNFWWYVSTVDAAPEPAEIGATLQDCHEVLGSFPEPLPRLAILTESLGLLSPLRERALFPEATLALLQKCLTKSLEKLAAFPHQPLHGDAHMGNLMNTTMGLLWADWEDAFSGPVEWDLASIIWNAKILEKDHATVDQILTAYRDAGGQIHEDALHHSLIARAAVMSVWYPILYPNPNAERREKLQLRLDWLEAVTA